MNLIRTTVIVAALLPWVTTAQPVWLNDGLVAYYPFDGDAKDYSGNNAHASGGIQKYSTDRFANVNSALEPNSESLLKTDSTLHPLGNVTVTYSAWVNLGVNDSPSATDGLILNAGECCNGDESLGKSSAFYVSTGGGGTILGYGAFRHADYRVDIPLETDKWAHLAIVKEKGKQTFFLNGTVITSALINSSLQNVESTTIALGWSGDSFLRSGGVFNGLLDDIRIYNRALSATEVAQLYEYESTPPVRPIEEWIDNNLVAYYPFNGDAKDYSGNGNDGFGVNHTYSTDRFGDLNASLRNTGQQRFETINEIAIDLRFLTYSIWIKNPGLGNGGAIISMGQTAINARSCLYMQGPDLNIGRTKSGIGYVGHGNDGFAPLEDSLAWTMVTLTKNGNLIKAYSNGDFLGEFLLQLSQEEIKSRIFLGWTGDSNHYGGSTFVGQIDDARIYNRALSATEVAQLYAYESQPEPSSNTHKASAMAQVVNGFIIGAEVLDGGYGYSSNPEVTISGGGGSGAVATATVSAGKVVKINIINPGFGYTGDPTIDIAAPPVPPAPAYATAEVVNGFLVGTLIVTGGDGYTEPPAVKVTGGNGQGAVLATEIANGRVVAVNVINPGSGYTTAPVITIAPPPTAPELSIRVTQVEVNMKLTEGKRYTIESSKNMVDWTQTGPLFVAEEQFMAVKFDVDEFGQFFRVIEQP